jgi:glycerol-3-phosphate O-acyltransferase
VLNYHFVLEAKSLIDQYLQQTGKELYMVEKKAFGGAWNLIKFLWKFFSATSEIIVNFGKPLDVLGNFVDEQGHSMDQFGRNIALRDYFISEGELRADRQRNEEYTKMLAQRLVQRYHIENVVLSSHLVAFTAFEILLKQYPKLDLYGILRLPDDDRIILRSVFIHNINLLRKKLHDMAQKGQIHLSEIVRQGSVEDLIKDGVANVGTFHVKKALTIDKEGDISSEDLNLLYYYHNRLEGYQLEKLIEVSPK